MNIDLKYRTWYLGVPPRPIKLEIPGWAGEKNWDVGQPWHCKPFKDGSTYGLELIYPFTTECTVTTQNGELIWTGDFTKESEVIGQEWERPFSSFAPNHFGFTSSLDIQTEEGYGIMILPHPRYYTDRTGTVPLIVAGIIESDFWSRVFFVVFKSPLEGQTYVFRKGEGYAQIIVVPKKVKYNIVPMTKEEARIRAEMEKTLGDYRKRIASKTWKTVNDEEFDNKYKILSGIASTKGVEGVVDHLSKVKEMKKRDLPKKLFRRSDVALEQDKEENDEC